MAITTIEELERARAECKQMVTNRSLMSGAASAVPGAVVGVMGDAAILLNLLPAINKAFGLAPEQIDQLDEQRRQQVFLMASNIGSAFIGKLVTEKLIVTVLQKFGVRIALKSAASFVPFVGNGIAAVAGFGMMKIVGNQHVDACYSVAKQMIESRAVTAPATAA